MWETIGQYVGGRVLTAILCVSGAGAVIWFWRHPEDLQGIWYTIKFALAWIGVVLVLPWAGFSITTWVVSKDSNRASALMLVGYVLVDVAFAFVLIGRVTGLNALSWVVLILGFLSAGVYNFKVCEYQAERLE